MIPELFHPLCAPFRLEGKRDEAVVLTHGFSGTAAHFHPMAEFLNGHGYTVNVPLLAGHGTSMEHMASTGWVDWLRSTRQAVDAVADHRRVHLVGLSMGGLLSILVAANTAASTVTTISTPILVRDPMLYLAPATHRLRPVVMWPEEPRPELDPEVAGYWLTYPGFHTKNAADLVHLMRKGLLVAGRLRRPALVIQSRGDETVHPASADLLRRRFGGLGRVTYLERAFHNALFSDERQVIHNAVLDHIQ